MTSNHLPESRTSVNNAHSLKHKASFTCVSGVFFVIQQLQRQRGDNMNNLFSTLEAAKFLGVTTRAIRKWKARGKITPVKSDERGYDFYTGGTT